jgi:chromosome segregation ATPase
MTIWTSPLDHHAWLLADRDATIAKLRAEVATAEEIIAQADRATQVVQAKLNTELREHAKTKRTLADTRIHVDELERLNERLLENAKRLTSELQQVEAVRDAGIREAVAAEMAARAARDETQPPPGFKHDDRYGSLPGGPFERFRRSWEGVSLREAWRIYHAEHGTEVNGG